jgi:hypothetical protein
LHYGHELKKRLSEKAAFYLFSKQSIGTNPVNLGKVRLRTSYLGSAEKLNEGSD